MEADTVTLGRYPGWQNTYRRLPKILVAEFSVADVDTGRVAAVQQHAAFAYRCGGSAV